MKNLIVGITLLLSCQASFAFVSTNCNPDQSVVTQYGSQVDAFVLLERISFLAPKNLLNNGQYQKFSSTLNATTKELGEPTDTQVQVKTLCDFHPQQAALDPNLKSLNGPLKQHQVVVRVLFPIKMQGDRKHNVVLFTRVELKGRAITSECADIFNCRAVYQFYVDSISTELDRGYQTGGFSSAGGGN